MVEFFFEYLISIHESTYVMKKSYLCDLLDEKTSGGAGKDSWYT